MHDLLSPAPWKIAVIADGGDVAVFQVNAQEAWRGGGGVGPAECPYRAVGMLGEVHVLVLSITK